MHNLKGKKGLKLYLLVSLESPRQSLTHYVMVLSRSILEDLLKRIRSEADTISGEELVLELNPMKTQCVEETLKHIHHEQYAKGS